MSIDDDLSVFARRTKLEHSRDREQLAELERADPMANVYGADERVAAMYRDQHRARVEELRARVKAKAERVHVAERGYFLVRHPQELNDPDWTRDHLGLMARAHAAGLTTDWLD